MNISIFAISIFVLTIFFVTSMSATPLRIPDADIIGWGEEIIRDCYEDEEETKPVQLTKDGLKNLEDDSLLDIPHSTKCLRYCLYKHRRLLSPSNPFPQSLIVDLINRVSNNTAEEHDVEAVASECSRTSVYGEDLCERSHLLFVCIFYAFDDLYASRPRIPIVN